MRRGIKPLLVSLVALTGGDALADELQFNTLYRSPYYLGRGGTGVASADNHEAIFYNPAGLALGKGLWKELVLISPSVQISTQTRDIAKQAFVDQDNNAEAFKGVSGKNIHFGINNFSGIVFRRFAIGALVSSEFNVMLSKDPRENAMETLHADAVLNRGPVVSAAESFFGDTLLLGATGKYIIRQEGEIDISAADAENIADKLDAEDVKQTRSGFGLDLGVMLKPKSWPTSFGLHIENIGGMSLDSSDEGVDARILSQIVTMGFAVEKATKTSSMSFQMDFRDVFGEVEKNTFKRLHLGADVKFADLFGLAGGLNQGYPTIGFFTDLYIARLDIGLMTQEMGSSAGLRPDQRIMFRLTAGF